MNVPVDRVGARDVAGHVFVVGTRRPRAAVRRPASADRRPGSAGWWRSGRCRRSTDRPTRRRRAAMHALRSPPSPRIRTRPAGPRACRPSARRSKSRALDEHCCSYGVLTSPQVGEHRRRVDSLEAGIALAHARRANSVHASAGWRRCVPAAGGRQEQEGAARRRPPMARDSTAPRNGSNWSFGSARCRMPVCARGVRGVSRRPRQCSFAGSVRLTNRISRARRCQASARASCLPGRCR